MYRFFLTVCALAAGYFLFYLPDLYARVKLDRSYPALSRYVFEPTPDIAMVGSSMSYRMYEQYFITPLRNLAIGGGSPETGLSIIASYKSIPRLILVGTNIPSRGVDPSLVRSFGANESEPFRWFWPGRAVISWVYTWLKYDSQQETISRLLAEPPSTYDISESVNQSFVSYKDKDWPAIMQPNVVMLRRLVDELRARGSEVLLFELPSPPEIETDPYVLTARRLMRAEFPDRAQWLTMSGDDLRFVDASHMDERSAILAARQIDEQLRARAGRR